MSLQPSKLRIIVVDDEPEICKLYLLLFKRHNLDCLGYYSDSKEAIQEFEKDSNFADLVVIDYRMPGIDGLTASKMIKEINPKVRMIMISAFETPLARTDLVLFDRILTKPVTTNELIDAVTTANMCEFKNTNDDSKIECRR